jgi:hypothetical protein
MDGPRRKTVSVCTVVALAFASVGCTEDAKSDGTGGMGGTGGTGGWPGLCATAFSYQPPSGTSPLSVAIAGEWNDFDPSALPMTGPDASGSYHASVELSPGLQGYKLVLNGTDWILDPAQGYRKYVDGTENSAVRVPVRASGETITLSLTGLADGKYTLRVVAKDADGKDSEPKRLVLWVAPRGRSPG